MTENRQGQEQEDERKWYNQPYYQIMGGIYVVHLGFMLAPGSTIFSTSYFCGLTFGIFITMLILSRRK